MEFLSRVQWALRNDWKIIFFVALVSRLALFFLIPVDWNSDSYHHWLISYYTLHMGLRNGRMWDLLGSDYYWGMIPHLVQSFLAFGSGGIFGMGLGEGRQKLFYLPDAHTDFILAVIGEELGLIGVVAVIGLFVLVMARGMLVALRASSLFGTFLAFGLTTMIVIPAFINMMVVMGLLPTKGLVLPFISYGGSALIIYMTAAGILLNVSAHMYRTR